MTISSSLSQVTILGNNTTQVFSFPFVGVAASDIVVTYTNASGISTQLSPSQYTLTLNAPLPGQIWGVGGSVTYPIIGSPISSGTSLTIARTLPLTQNISIADQGDFSPQVIERMGDTLCMQLQQIQAATNSSNPPNVFACGPVTGTANAITVSTTFPSNFSLNPGTLVSFTPTQFNTGSATLNILGTGNVVLQKPGFAGLVNLVAGDLDPGLITYAQYNGTVWSTLIPLANYEQTISVNTNIGIAQGYIPYVCTAPLTLTIASSLTLINWWYVDIYALGGAVVISINASDQLNGAGAGVGLTMPSGTSGRLITDANGNLYLTGLAGSVSGVTAATYTNPTITVNKQGLITSASNGTSFSSSSVVINAITGCFLSSITGNAATASATVGSGYATDSTNSVVINSAGYSWGVTNGNNINGYSSGVGLPTNSVTTVHIYLCQGTSGVGTYGIPNSSYPLAASSAPTGYKNYVRRIDSFITNSSGTPIAKTSVEEGGGAICCYLSAVATDINNQTATTSTRTLYTFSIPQGIKVEPISRYSAGPTTNTKILVTSPDEPDTAVGDYNVNPGVDAGNASAFPVVNSVRVTSNTSGQIGVRANLANNIYVFTRGWIDFRRN